MNPVSILLLGPTATGKTPLGRHLADEGVWGRRCFHFDFGHVLRSAAAGDHVATGLGGRDLDVIKWSLETGALLENEHFPIAARLLNGFWHASGAGPEDILVLNGLPRHAGQARDVAAHADIRVAICLDCNAATVQERIRCNSGGDRKGRVDDTLAAVENKLAIYRNRTAPLVAFYKARGVPVLKLAVGCHSTAADMRQALENHEIAGCLT